MDAEGVDHSALLRAITEGESNGRRCPLVRSALKRDFASVLLSNPLRDRQAQAGSTRVAAVGRVGAVEPFKDMGQVLWWNAGAGIVYRDHSVYGLALQAQRNLPTSRGVLERIIEQDQEQLFESVLVPLDPGRLK